MNKDKKTRIVTQSGKNPPHKKVRGRKSLIRLGILTTVLALKICAEMDACLKEMDEMFLDDKRKKRKHFAGRPIEDLQERLRR